MKDKAFIKQMLDAISQIENYTNDIDYENFKNNKLRQDGVVTSSLT